MRKLRAALLALLAYPACALGQTPAARPAFYAASVKPAPRDDMRGSTFEFPPGGLKVTNGTLLGVIESAFEVRDFQIEEAPAWANSNHFNIVAKSAPDDPAAAQISETRQKLQTLLADRFHLKAHPETRDLPIYILAVGKSGVKLKEGKASNTPTGIQMTCGQMTGTSASMAGLAIYLSRQLGRPVQDHTNLPGRYDFHVEWTPDSGPCAGTTTGDGTPAAAVNLLSGPSLFTALQEQLGLRMESTKGPVEVIVIDSVEKPDEN